MSSSYPSATLWRRLAALVYDAFLLFGLLMIYGYIVVLCEQVFIGAEGIERSPTAGGNPFVFAGMLILIGSFYCLFWLRNQQTLGMQAWRLQLETLDGSPLTLQHCIRRLLAGILSFACLGIGFLWCLGPARTTWHDQLSRTRVVVHEKRK